MKRNLPLSILIILFIGIWIIREIKVYSAEPKNQLIQLLTSQGYQDVKITDSDFSFCPRVLEIPVRFQASMQNKLIEGIACFSSISSASPRIQFKN